jgi:SAM-dependent methyltransferase
MTDSPPVADRGARGAEERRIESAYARRDSLRQRYAWTNPGHLFTVQQLERVLVGRLADARPRLDSDRILEVGCGNGYWLRQLATWGATPDRLTGVDLLAGRIAEARRLCPPDVTLLCGSAAAIDSPDAQFDVILQFTTFTSIQSVQLKQAIAAEMRRLLAPDGLIIWYDFFRNNPRNPDVRGVDRVELQALFPDCVVDARRVTLAPPIARAVAPISWTLCQLLHALPLLRTHYLAFIRPRAANAPLTTEHA